MSHAVLRAAFVAALILPPLPSQRPAAGTSGPARGTLLPALPAVVVAGADKGKEIDAAAALRRGPAAILFVHELTRNTSPMLRAFDELTGDLAVLGFQGAIVRLADDRTEAET